MEKINKLICLKKGNSFIFTKINLNKDGVIKRHTYRVSSVSEHNGFFVVGHKYGGIRTVFDNFKEVVDLVCEFYQEELPEDEIGVTPEDIIYIDHDVETMFYVYKLINDDFLKYEDLVHFNEEFSMIRKNIDEKIYLLNELYLTNIKTHIYKLRGSTKKAKDAIDDLLRRKKYSNSQYLSNFLQDIVVIKKYVSKNDELMKFIDENFITNFREVLIGSYGYAPEFDYRKKVFYTKFL